MIVNKYRNKFKIDFSFMEFGFIYFGKNWRGGILSKYIEQKFFVS